MTEWIQHQFAVLKALPMWISFTGCALIAAGGSLAAYAVAERLCNARTYAITPTRAMELLFAGVLISLFSPIAMRIVNGAIYSYQFDVALLFYFGPLIPLGVWLVGVIIVGRVMVASKPELEGGEARDQYRYNLEEIGRSRYGLHITPRHHKRCCRIFRMQVFWRKPSISNVGVMARSTLKTCLISELQSGDTVEIVTPNQKLAKLVEWMAATGMPAGYTIASIERRLGRVTMMLGYLSGCGWSWRTALKNPLVRGFEITRS
ncbi:hypothetical protein N5J01_14560 [Stenotrophomonas sp. GD03701]|uniref:Transmembrane protein n=1 Tax=Stenotrophomonas maltophilia TaxID=40324 RepID=A0A2J0SPT8_STEMA|nr:MULTISPECIES: hypothetical protein [Stenotrophomonas]MBA0313306.1 hypothetical protein [Stenotrophomonas maltophilia]MBH1745156.1 hypothetical protein [Stenotrophomonas maltophilia]MBH1865989.1 hypothetical protein [Stenotrophomonas maltophilia]MDH1389633.1 hypothetical protein [Stenotrophomonas sp. GD03701]MDH1394240.1 hypothetical protein [Stenotrophomonas sp. GD03702]